MGVYLVVKDDVVENTIVWDGVSPYKLSDGAALIAQPGGVGVGWRLVDGVWAAPSVPVDPVNAVSMRQARLALLGAGLLDDVEAAVAAADQATRIEWEYASTVERHNSLVRSLTAALGLTEAQLDALFAQAATL